MRTQFFFQTLLLSQAEILFFLSICTFFLEPFDASRQDNLTINQNGLFCAFIASLFLSKLLQV